MGDGAAAAGVSKTFQINGNLLKGQQNAQLTLQGADNDAILAAVLAGQPFPAGKLSLGSIKMAASTGNTIPFEAAGAKDSVVFGANIDGFFDAGVYPDPADLLQDLSPNPQIGAGIVLKKEDGQSYLMMRCGYNASATAKGAMALGTGASVNFAASASGDATYAVIHEFANTDSARTAIADTVSGWILPNQFDGAGAFPGRTWVIAEVDGSVALNVGVQAGYDYSWLRQFPGGALKGDLGLKIQLAANAALGFSANGSFALMLAKETGDDRIRLCLYKLAKDGWTFAFNASAGGQVTLPDVFQQGKNINDLISAVFGVHIAQLAADLTDPNLTSASSVAGFIVQRGLKEIPGESDVEKLFAAGLAKVKEFTTDWSTLTHQPATMLAAIMQKAPAIAALTPFLQAIHNASDQTGVKDLLASALSKADYFQTPIGQWIESVVPTTALAALVSSDDWKAVQSLSGTALNIINGQTLQSLIDYASGKLDLNQIAQAIQNNAPASLDAWLQAKIAAFLGNNPGAQVVLGDLQKAQTALKALEDKAEKFYDMALQAVQKKYEIDFTSSYQKSTSSTALLDATFDLTAGPDTLAALRQAINGDMQQILLQEIPGVTIAKATLTHDINRQSHSDLTMPFIDLSSSDVSDSLASVSPVEDNGRVLVYNLTAQDEAKTHQGFFRASTESNSKLSFVASLPVPVQSGVRSFSKSSISCGYTLTKGATSLKAAQLQLDLQPLADTYMPGLFDGGKPPLSAWVSAVDQQVDSGKTGVLGETLFTFNVALPPEAFAPWFATSANAKDPMYFAMSKAVQAFLRRVIPFYFFSDGGRYDANSEADTILAYGALPPSNGFMGSMNHEIYFGVDAENLGALIKLPAFLSALEAAMQKGQEISTKASDQYVISQANVNRIAANAMQMVEAPRLLSALLLFEFDLVNAITRAGVQNAGFMAQAATQPAAALKQLSAFGDTFVQAFNNRLGSNVLAGDSLRPLGSALLVEAGRALAQNGAPPVKAAGLFRLTVVGGTPAVSLDDLMAGNLGSATVLLRETLVSE
jgi:hypothetical protein